MKKIYFSILLLLIALNAFAQGDSVKIFPNVNLKNMNGETISTSTFNNGKESILLIFWNSTYKIPSIELDVIEENYQNWKSEMDVKVIVISVDDSRTAARVSPVVSAKGWSFEFYLDINSDFKRAMNVNSLPHTFIITRVGEIVWQTVGFLDGEENLIYEKLLNYK